MLNRASVQKKTSVKRQVTPFLYASTFTLSLGDVTRRNAIRRPHEPAPHSVSICSRADSKQDQKPGVPVAMVNFGCLPQQLLLPSLIGPVPSHLISIRLRLQQGDQVYTTPHLLAGEFAVPTNSAVSQLRFYTAGWGTQRGDGVAAYLSSRAPLVYLYKPHDMIRPTAAR